MDSVFGELSCFLTIANCLLLFELVLYLVVVQFENKYHLFSIRICFYLLSSFFPLKICIFRIILLSLPHHSEAMPREVILL